MLYANFSTSKWRVPLLAVLLLGFVLPLSAQINLNCPPAQTVSVDANCEAELANYVPATTITLQAGQSLNPDKVAAGFQHSLAIDDQGRLWSWGISGDRLGRDPITTGLVNEPGQVGTATNWVSVSTGERASYAINSDGELYSWGENNAGQLGHGNLVDQDTPTRVGSDQDWQAVAGGRRHVIALKRDGTVYTWGENLSAQLGYYTSGNAPVLTPTLVTPYPQSNFGPLPAIAQIGAGSNRCVLLTTDKKVIVWGNHINQVGTTLTKYLSIDESANPGGDTDWKDFSVGVNHLLLTKTDNSLYTLGLNNNGQLGLGTSGGGTDVYIEPVRVGTDNDWKDITAGGQFSLAVKENGTLWGWGLNTINQLGLGADVSNKSTPTRIGLDADWEALGVANNNGHSFGIKSNGEVYGWGDNNEKQTGVGGNDSDPVTTPQLLPQITIVEALSYIQSPSAGTVIGAGPQMVTITANSSATGETGNCTFTVTAEDNTPPTAVCVTDPITVELGANGMAVLDPMAADDGSTDNCGVATLSLDLSTFDCSHAGDQTVTLTVTDVNGNTDDCTATVTVSSCNGAPTLTCAPVTVDADGDCEGAAAGADFVSTSNDPDGDMLTFTPAPAGPYALGTTNVTVTADDGNGETATCMTTITVEDNAAPTADCVAPFTVDIDAVSESVSVTPEMLDNSSTDNCSFTLAIDGGNPTYTCSDVGQAFTLQLNITDGSSNTDNCTVEVTVGDANSVCYTCDLGFTVEAPATMTDPAVPPGIITSRIVCGSDGTITVNAFCNGCDDGETDLEYSINGTDFQPENFFDGLDEGDYTVTIRDADNPDCFATTSATIGECVGEIPNNGQDDDCDSETDEPGTVAWILLEAGGDAPCISTTDDCDGTFCYGLEYTPAVSGTLTSYTTGFTMDCIADATPLISNLSCVMVDNSFDAEDCAGGNGAFFNSSGNNGTVMIKKDESIILHQICLTLPISTTVDIVEDMITDITMSIDVPAVLSTGSPIVATDRPEYTTATAAGNFPPEATITGTIDDCYLTEADAEAAAVAATSATDDYTDVADLTFTPSTDGDCAAIITVTVSDLCGLTDEVTFNTRIDGDGPVITGDLPASYEGCVLADFPAFTSVAALEGATDGTLMIADNCTDDADLVVSLFDESASGTCPINVSRTYRITDECGRTSDYVQ